MSKMIFDVIPTPEEFALLMKSKLSYDKEKGHIEMDDLMEVLLRTLGYSEAMNIFDSQGKWYT